MRNFSASSGRTSRGLCRCGESMRSVCRYSSMGTRTAASRPRCVITIGSWRSRARAMILRASRTRSLTGRISGTRPLIADTRSVSYLDMILDPYPGTKRPTLAGRPLVASGGPLLRALLLVQRFLIDLQDCLVLRRDGERDHAGDQPFGPHLVDLGLEVLHVLVDEVSEAALALQVLVHRLALLAALGDLPGRTGEVADAVDDLVERPDPALDGEMAELLAVLRVVVPSFRAGVERVDERRAAELEGLADLVHKVDRVRRASSRDVTRLRVARGEHARHVLLPTGVHEALLAAARGERGHRAVRRLTRELDVGVRVALVVIEENEAVVFLVRQGRGDGAEAHVRSAAVTTKSDDVDLLVLELALAHQDLEPCCGAERRRAGGAELGVHPSHDA